MQCLFSRYVYRRTINPYRQNCRKPHVCRGISTLRLKRGMLFFRGEMWGVLTMNMEAFIRVSTVFNECACDFLRIVERLETVLNLDI
jgi:hypothetical protein